jgi:hypothetical protein
MLRLRDASAHQRRPVRWRGLAQRTILRSPFRAMASFATKGPSLVMPWGAERRQAGPCACSQTLQRMALGAGFRDHPIDDPTAEFGLITDDLRRDRSFCFATWPPRNRQAAFGQLWQPRAHRCRSVDRRCFSKAYNPSACGGWSGAAEIGTAFMLQSASVAPSRN